MKKRLLSLLIVLFAVLMPMKSWAQEPYAVLSEDNTVLTFYYDDQKAARGGIAIGSYGPANYEPWYENRTTLTTAVFDESFANDTTLTSTAYWFHECIKLTEIKGLEYLKTDKVTDMRNMFYGCSKLTTLDVSHFKTGNVTNMNLMFYYCSGLTSLDVKGFNTENVTDMGSMFNNCSGLKSLDISSFKTEKVKDMIQMFYQCYNLTTIYAGNGWSTASVTADYGYHMFTDCTALVGGRGTTYDKDRANYLFAHIDGGPSNPGYFTRSGDAPYTESEPYAVLSENNTVLTFYYDDQKTTRNGMSVGPFAAETDRGWDEYKGNINTAIFDDSFANCSTITSTAYWFASCYNSLTIQGLNNLKTDNVTDMTMMFHSTWLKDVDVSGFNTSKVTSMRNMFSACSMSSLDVSNFNTENVTDFNGMFSSNSHLTSLDLKNFNTANATSLRAMFSGCTQLTNIDLSSFNTANVTDMNNMFSSCTNLQHLDLSHFNTDKVRDIRRMFLDCRNLTSLDISSLKTDSVLSMEMLFENCAKLESLDLSSFNTKDIWEMRYMFDGCTNLKTIYVGSEWNTGKVSSGENMFRNCTNLVGGKGTTYDANHVDYTYARIDGGPSNPGYFTDKNAQADDGLELYAIDVESEMKSNETFMPTQSVKMTLGNDSEWSTNNDLAPELGGELKFDANIYYPGIYNKNYAFVSSVVGTNNPAAGPLVDGMSTGSSYKPRWRNLPESGAYFIFESEQDGSLIVPIRINPNKPLYVTDDAGVPLIAYQLKDQDGVTVALDANSSTAEKTIAFLSLNVSKNQKYYIFCKGSKPRVGGYIFAPHTIDIDPATTAAALDSLLAEPVDATFDSNGVLSVGGGTTMADALEYVGGRAEVAKTITAIVWNSTASLTNDDLKGLDNPNMLIYVKDAALAPANRDNVVIGGLAKNIVLADVESGNNNFYCPQAFTAEMISYTRNFQQQTEIGVSRGWETIALPFTVQTIMHEKNGVITPFGNEASDKHFWLRQLTQEGLARATAIEANAPYIISMPNNNEYPAEFNLPGRVTFSSQDALVPMTEYTSVHMAVENGMLMFVPCFQTTQAHDMIYALNVGETRGNHPEGSVFEANYRDVRPFEAFTVHEGGNKPAPQFILVFELNQAGFTGIENVRSHMSNGRGENWYDLNGRRLQQKPKQKGVYLHNGHQVVIK